MIMSFLIAIGLNFDTFSVAVVEGAEVEKPKIYDAFIIGICFSIGQAGLALVGSFIGVGFSSFITTIDHWIAFILLSVIGGKTIIESSRGHYKHSIDLLHVWSIFPLVLATSIDALAVGVTFAFFKNAILQNIITIALVTFIISFLGFYTGRKLKRIIGHNITIIGGLILIGIGIKILIEHLQ